MSEEKRLQNQIDFCVSYLLSNNIDPIAYANLCEEVKNKKVNKYKFILDDNDFFTQVAQGLWDLWPKRKKDDKYPWKDSVPVLVKRLEFIWSELEVDRTYSVEDCIQVGREYLAQFENSSLKYMQLLKYFIFKQKQTGIKKDGFIKVEYGSTLINMLQNKPNWAEEIEASENLFDNTEII